MNFEKLREMDAFSDAMLNRIISFQERQHPAWDENANFAQRIKDLPLHALVFSNPDRNPETHRQTVAPFYPLRAELRRIAGLIKAVSATAKVVDFECGNGFITSLLAREGVSVQGYRGEHYKPNQIESFYDASVVEIKDHVGDEVDVALSIWMPSGENLTPMMLSKNPKLVIYMYTDYEHEGVHQTGMPAAFTDLPANYKLIEEWSITRPADIFHAIWPDLTPSMEEVRHTRIYASTDYFDIETPDDDAEFDSYDWEKELDMTLLAHEAKQFLQAKGIVS